MEIKVQTLIATKAFWVSESGIRLNCKAAISAFSPDTIELDMQERNQQDITGAFWSSDGFNYHGKIHLTGLEYMASCRCYVTQPGVLLCGEWKNGNISCEFCIHASLQGIRIKKTGTNDNDYLSPAA